MKAINEFEAEGDQQCHEGEQERQKRRDPGAAGIDVGVKAVGYEKQARAEQS
jgi:hypothetical protein